MTEDLYPHQSTDSSHLLVSILFMHVICPTKPLLPVQKGAEEELSWDVPLCQGHSNVRALRKGEPWILEPN